MLYQYLPIALSFLFKFLNLWLLILNCLLTHTFGFCLALSHYPCNKLSLRFLFLNNWRFLSTIEQSSQCSYWWVSSRKNFGQFLVCGLHNHIWGQLPPKVLLILNEWILKKVNFLIFLLSKINFEPILTLFPKLS